MKFKIVSNNQTGNCLRIANCSCTIDNLFSYFFASFISQILSESHFLSMLNYLTRYWILYVFSGLLLGLLSPVEIDTKFPKPRKHCDKVVNLCRPIRLVVFRLHEVEGDKKNCILLLNGNRYNGNSQKWFLDFSPPSYGLWDVENFNSERSIYPLVRGE